MSATQKLLRFGVYELNLDTVELRKSGTLVKLPRQPFKVLAYLAAHAGQIVTREEIQSQLWGEDTHVDFEHGVNKCIKQIRAVLGDDADKPLYIETLPRHGYRFLAPVVSKTIAAPGPKVIESQSGERSRSTALGPPVIPAPPIAASLARQAQTAPVAQAAPAPQAEPAVEPSPGDVGQRASPVRRRRSLWIIGAALIIVLAAGLYYWRAHKRTALTGKDTVVLADFENQTGDPVFDDTLRQALAIQLEQSPFLNVLSDGKLGATLKLMNRWPGARLTSKVAREVCLRSNSKAVINGSIALAGTEYLIVLKAEDCDSGDVLAQAQAQSRSKEEVIPALDTAASSLRAQLGESLSSIQKFSTPLIEATTPSLEALRAYSLGRKISYAKGPMAALPFHQHAVELDPDFARVYAAMANFYSNVGESEKAAENARTAYRLSSKVSEPERLFIQAIYYVDATGELDKVEQVCRLWQETYPRDYTPYAILGSVYARLGNWTAALGQFHQAMRLEPNRGNNYHNVGVAYTSLNRFDEAEAVYRQAQELGFQGALLQQARYELAFLSGDANQMQQLASASAEGEPGTADLLLAAQADTAAWYGKLAQAHDLTHRATDEALQNNARERAASYVVSAALVEVEAGRAQAAHADIDAALKTARNRDVLAMAGLALARAGDAGAAHKLATELNQRFPLDTLVRTYWLPSVEAAVALHERDPRQAIEILKRSSGVELGQPAEVQVFLCPAYLRGETYLALRDGAAASIEFQKFIENYGLVGNFPWGALARLGVARAYALQAETDPAARDKARAAYENFLALWNGADPNLPIYQQAKAEGAKLQ